MPSYPIKVDEDSPFPIQNLPFGIFSSSDNKRRRACTAVGNFVLDLALLEQNGLLAPLPDHTGQIFSQPTLNVFASLSKNVRRQARDAITELLSNEASPLFNDKNINIAAFHDSESVQMHLPMAVPEFTDFSCYEEHVGNACKMNNVRIPPNFYQSPMAYNGRTSSIVLSGTSVRKPKGLYLNSKGEPELQESAKLDFELEMGVFVSKPVPWGQTITADEAWEEHIFGYVLINDWSARDIQAYESVPLGPLNSKSFATSMSPWVLVPEALESSKTSPLHQKPGAVLPHLQHKSLEGTTQDINIVSYLTRKGKEEKRLSVTNFSHSYFSVGQILCHRALSGCGLRTGELLALGTMSSPKDVQVDEAYCHQACLWELTEDGKVDVPIVGGKFLEAGDIVRFEAWAGGENHRKVGFGSLTTKIVAPL